MIESNKKPTNMNIIHLKTIVQSVFVKLDGKGNAVEMPPLQVAITDFCPEEFEKIYAMIDSKRKELDGQTSV
jgi:hypothetical protein